MSRLAAAARLAVLIAALAGPAFGQAAAPTEAPDRTDPLDRMLAALRVEDTLAARIEARVTDHTGSTRETTIEMLRDATEATMRTVVEVREEGTALPFLFRIDTRPDGSIVSWNWDIRFGQFVKVAGLEGTEPFAGTHFRLEDLGFTGLAPRRGGQSHLEGEGAGARLHLTSAPYHYYGRVEMWLDPATDLPERTVIFDGTGARIWEIEFDEVSDEGGAALPRHMRAVNPISREESVLTWTTVDVGLPIPPERFDLEVLGAKMRRGDDPVELPAAARGSQAAPATGPVPTDPAPRSVASGAVGR